jgi:hypothetical protein
VRVTGSSHGRPWQSAAVGSSTGLLCCAAAACPPSHSGPGETNVNRTCTCWVFKTFRCSCNCRSAGSNHCLQMPGHGHATLNEPSEQPVACSSPWCHQQLNRRTGSLIKHVHCRSTASMPVKVRMCTVPRTSCVMTGLSPRVACSGFERIQRAAGRKCGCNSHGV